MNRMSFQQGVVLALFLGFLSFQSAESLKCFQCADTQLNTNCYHDYEGLINTSKGLNQTYKKDCTDSNNRWDRCVIETHITGGGKHTLFKRGCHDGKYFNKNIDDKEFHNLTANNFTTCARPKLELVCFTFCDMDYCNGPQPIPDLNACTNGTNLTLSDGLECASCHVHGNGFLQIVGYLLVTNLIWVFAERRHF